MTGPSCSGDPSPQAWCPAQSGAGGSLSCPHERLPGNLLSGWAGTPVPGVPVQGPVRTELTGCLPLGCLPLGCHQSQLDASTRPSSSVSSPRSSWNYHSATPEAPRARAATSPNSLGLSAPSIPNRHLRGVPGVNWAPHVPIHGRQAWRQARPM